MAYTKTNWKARKGTNLNKFTKSGETAESVILTNAPDAITEPGTPFSVENMNHIEQGIADAHDLITAEAQARQQGDTESIAAHNISDDTHADIREAIAEEAKIRDETDQEIQKQINALSPEGLDEIAMLLAELPELPDQLALKAPINDPTFTGTVKVPSKTTAATDDGTLVATEAQVLAVKLAAWPVDAVYMSVGNTSPAELFGGTWTVWGAGRVPVGVATSGTFNTVEKEGGYETHTLSKSEMPSHAHTAPAHIHTFGRRKAVNNFDNTIVYEEYISVGRGEGSIETSTTGQMQLSGGGQTLGAGADAAHNNLQPYITCYMWKRTA